MRVDCEEFKSTEEPERFYDKLYSKTESNWSFVLIIIYINRIRVNRFEFGGKNYPALEAPVELISSIGMNCFAIGVLTNMIFTFCKRFCSNRFLRHQVSREEARR